MNKNNRWEKIFKGVSSHPVVLLLIFTLAVEFIYVFSSKQSGFQGFPLDDAWIHQTYARNLANTGTWAFIPGQPSAGSTSPLWSVLLSIGYRLGVTPTFWAYFLGGICLFLTAWVAEKSFRKITGCEPRLPWTGLLIILEWHLVWASVSGMETLLFCLLSLATIYGLLQEVNSFWLIGFMVGTAVWVRPDGVTLLGPVLFTIFFKSKNLKTLFISLAQAIGAFLILFGPYLSFNQVLAGTIWPNTYYAKQIEYAILIQQPLLFRFLLVAEPPLVGIGALMLPGLIWKVFNLMKQRNAAGVGAFLWIFGYLVLYAFRLPVTYQHGRYLMPVIPVLIVLGLSGTVTLYQSFRNSSFIKRVVSKTLIAAIGVVALIFFIIGAGAYAQDVATIETEMVASAQWIANNTVPGDLVAAHDIGALGYFGQRKLLDLAGLISPDVIPFIRDEKQLTAYMNQMNVKYLVTFPNWYPNLTKNRHPIFSTEGKFAPAQGGENMAVYRWP